MLVALALLFALPDTALAPTPAALDRAIETYTAPFDASPEKTTRQVAYADLNGDGLTDALIRLEGPAWCGSGGCTLLVVEAMPNADAKEMGRYHVAAEIAMVTGPVGLADSATHGWRDLVVHDGQGEAMRLAFTGETYAMSPAEGSPLGTAPWAVALDTP